MADSQPGREISSGEMPLVSDQPGQQERAAVGRPRFPARWPAIAFRSICAYAPKSGRACCPGIWGTVVAMKLSGASFRGSPSNC